MSFPFLNLLPPDRRRAYDEFLLFLALRRFAIVLGIFFVLVSGLLYGSTILLQQKVLQEQASTEAVEQRLSDIGGASFEQQIRDFNQMLGRVNTLQNGTVHWTPILHDLWTIVPAGVTFTSVEVDANQKTIAFRGTATVRDDLLSFQNALAHSERFSNPSSPISNLLQRENIVFEIHASVILP